MGNMTNFAAKHLERKANNRAARKVTIIDCSKVSCYKEKALNEPIVLPRISIRTILSRKCNGCTPNVPCDSTVIMPSLYLQMSFYPSPLKRNKTSNRRLIPRSKWGRSLSPILRSFRIAKASSKVAHLKNAKKITLVLWASSPVFWKTRMKDGGLRIVDEGKRIRDQRSPFHRQKKFPPQLEIQSLIQRCGEKTKKHCS